MTLERITTHPEVCGGKPCIRGLRFPVSRLLGLLVAGETPKAILQAYPYLEAEDIGAALRHGDGLLARHDMEMPAVLAGKALFYQSGCSACHTPKYVTRRDAVQEANRFQLIWPYTDLLLHDMGEGLADGQTAGDADGREWRTPPLWGIGLTETVNGHTLFLHDGRARNLLEAILWHGGEAQAARAKVVAMTPGERSALIRFLHSL